MSWTLVALNPFWCRTSNPAASNASRRLGLGMKLNMTGRLADVKRTAEAVRDRSRMKSRTPRALPRRAHSAQDDRLVVVELLATGPDTALHFDGPGANQRLVVVETHAASPDLRLDFHGVSCRNGGLRLAGGIHRPPARQVRARALTPERQAWAPPRRASAPTIEESEEASCALRPCLASAATRSRRRARRQSAPFFSARLDDTDRPSAFTAAPSRRPKLHWALTTSKLPGSAMGSAWSANTRLVSPKVAGSTGARYAFSNASSAPITRTWHRSITTSAASSTPAEGLPEVNPSPAAPSPSASARSARAIHWRQPIARRWRQSSPAAAGTMRPNGSIGVRCESSSASTDREITKSP